MQSIKNWTLFSGMIIAALVGLAFLLTAPAAAQEEELPAIPIGPAEPTATPEPTPTEEGPEWPKEKIPCDFFDFNGDFTVNAADAAFLPEGAMQDKVLEMSVQGCGNEVDYAPIFQPNPRTNEVSVVPNASDQSASGISLTLQLNGLEVITQTQINGFEGGALALPENLEAGVYGVYLYQNDMMLGGTLIWVESGRITIYLPLIKN